MNSLKSLRNGSKNNTSKNGTNSTSNALTNGNKGAGGRKGGRLETIKSLSTRGKSNKKKKVFGERCFDYISSCRHQFDKRPTQGLSADASYVFCPFCRLINFSLKPMYEAENLEKQVARAQSLKNRSILRTKLLYQWSQSQSFHYQYMELDTCIDFIWSISLANSIISNDSLLALIQKKKKTSSLWSQPSHLSGLSLLNNEETLPEIDFEEMIRILQRNKRITEVGHFSATLIQSHIRKFLTKLKIRRRILKRFEYVPATRTQSDFYYDLKTKRRWNYAPRLIQWERPATPRTVDRRLNHEQKLVKKKYDNYLQYLQIQQMKYDKNPFLLLDLFQRDIRIIQFLKQLILVRDVLVVIIYQLNELETWKLQRKEEEEKQAAANDLLSQLSVKTMSSMPIENSGKDIPPMTDGTNSISLRPVWLVPTAPGLPSRQLGLAIALATIPSPANRIGTPAAATPGLTRSDSMNSTPATTSRRRDAVSGAGIVVLSPLQRALQILEQHVWESLICRSAEEIIQKLLVSDLLPIYESVMNFAQDEFGIWNAQYKKLSAANASTTGLPTVDPTPNSSSYSLLPVSEPLIEETTKSETKEDSNSPCNTFIPPIPEILPFGFQLRIATNTTEVSANGFFRLFFYEEEWIALSTVSPWVYYPEVYRNKDGILASVNRFIQQPMMKSFIHNIYKSANKTHPRYQQEKDLRSINSSQSKRKMSSLSQVMGLGRKKSSAALLNNSTAKSTSQISKREPYLSLFIPPETMIFDPLNALQNGMGENHENNNDISSDLPVGANNRTTMIGMGMDKKSIYNESIIQDINTLTDEQILFLHEQYRFLRKNRTFEEKHKRVLQNLLRRQEKERKEKEAQEKLQRDQQPLLIEDLENDDDLTQEGERKFGLDASINDNTEKDKKRAKTPPSLSSSTKSMKDLKLSRKASVRSTSSNDSQKINTKLPSLLEKVDWKQAFQHVGNELKGKEIFELYMDPTGNKRKQQEKEVQSKELGKESNRSGKGDSLKSRDETNETEPAETQFWDNNEYIRQLFITSTEIDTQMDYRINAPPDLLENYPVAQLLVMDVYLTLPKPNKNDLSTTRKQSVSYGGGNTLIFPVNIHQVVGIFPCESEKCPANLDCGFFDYEEFHQLWIEEQAKNKDKDDQSIKSSGTSNTSQRGGSMADLSASNSFRQNTSNASKENANQYFLRDKNWSHPDPNSGLCVGKTMLSSGNEFKYKLLGQWPSKEYLESNLPKKVKNWLGLPT